MFKALHLQTQEEFISIAAQWAQRMPQLRALAQEDLLVCQGCREPVLLRAGVVRRPHFAHKSLQNCSYGHASPRRLQARAILYARLVREFGDAVTLEKQLEGASLPSPVDCWVERSSGTLAYWIIEGSIKSQQERCGKRSQGKMPHENHPSRAFS